MKFGQDFANQIRRRRPAPGDKWHLDEVVISIAGKKHWLWRAVDQHEVVLDILVQSRRNAEAAKRLLRKLLKRQGRTPRVMITDKLASYAAAKKAVMPGVEHRQHNAFDIFIINKQVLFSCLNDGTYGGKCGERGRQPSAPLPYSKEGPDLQITGAAANDPYELALKYGSNGLLSIVYPSFLCCRSDEVSGCELVLQVGIVDRCRNKAGQPKRASMTSIATKSSQARARISAPIT